MLALPLPTKPNEILAGNLESQWPVIMGYFGSFMGYFGV